MGEMADLWDEKFAGKFSKEPEVNKYLIELNHIITDLALLLKEAHDMMDDFNSSWWDPNIPKCAWCAETNYDEHGLKHKENCILVKIRKVIVT